MTWAWYVPPSTQRDSQRVDLVDDVVVCRNVTTFVDDDAGSHAADLAILGTGKQCVILLNRLLAMDVDDGSLGAWTALTNGVSRVSEAVKRTPIQTSAIAAHRPRT